MAELSGHVTRLQPRQTKIAVQAVRAAAPISLEIDFVEQLWSSIADKDDWFDFNKTIQDIRALGERLQA